MYSIAERVALASPRSNKSIKWCDGVGGTQGGVCGTIAFVIMVC